MSEVIRKRHTEKEPLYLKFSGSMPPSVLKEIKVRYGEYLEEDGEWIDYFETPLAKETERSLTPGKRLRNLREVHNLTQRELAAKAGLTASNLSDLERGRRGMGVEVARRLGEALNCPWTLLLGKG